MWLIADLICSAVGGCCSSSPPPLFPDDNQSFSDAIGVRYVTVGYRTSKDQYRYIVDIKAENEILARKCIREECWNVKALKVTRIVECVISSFQVLGPKACYNSLEFFPRLQFSKNNMHYISRYRSRYYNHVFLLLLLFLFGLWGYWHCGHSWHIVPASGDSEDDCREADGM
jgi:hypothetical protein